MLKHQIQRGVELLNNRQAVDAVVLFSQLLSGAPDNVECWDYLATALYMGDQHADAENAFRRCVELGARYPETLSNAARNAARLQNPERQLEYARHLTALHGKPRYEGLRQSADALTKIGRHVDALAANQQLLREIPDDFDAQVSIVGKLLNTGMSDAALERCQALLQQRPDHIPLQLSRIEASFVTGDMAAGFCYAEQLLQNDPDNLSAMSALGFHYQFSTEVSVAKRRAHAQRFGQLLSAITPLPAAVIDTTQGRDLRIGLLTGDLRNHPVGFFMHALLKALEHSSLQFYVFDPVQKHDALTAEIRPFIKQWHDVGGLTDTEIALAIRNNQIDILLDLQGYMTANRLAVYAYRPAPLQISWMGFQGTTGAPGIDYVLVDHHCVPHGAEHEFVEQVWRLPENTLCFTPPQVTLEVTPPPAVANGYVTFGSLNNPDKLNDHVLALWARMLNAVPNSRLLLRGTKFHSRVYTKAFMQRAMAAGLDASRMTIEGPAARDVFLKTYQRIDIALDPFPCSGATTTAEALWAGVPVLSLKGDRMVWRMAISMLTACGLEDWLADDADHFVALAQAKALDLQSLVALRRRQRDQVLASPLFDAKYFAGQFETTLRAMWDHKCSAQI
ncbi:MAG: hypothetical protein Q8L06_00945 [Pseudohongiella sp.]|nr:hypothetical protein [Pseudohongiella sp.]